MPVKPLQGHRIHLPRPQRAFTLVELTMVLVIVALLLGGVMAMVSAQTEQRKWRDTQSQLEAARDALLGYAIANGRLPCPANSNSAGAEVPAGGGVCGAAGNNYDYYGGVVGGVTYGLLPAVTLGYLPVDTQGFALDAWGNRIRYAVSKVTTPAFSPNFTSTVMKTNGLSVLPYDLIVCASNTGTSVGPPPTCGATATNWVTGQKTVVAILYSPGKNGRDSITLGADEAANEDRTTGTGNDAVFISHTPAPSGATGGEFDDQVLWLSVGTLYSKLVAAQVLP